MDSLFVVIWKEMVNISLGMETVVRELSKREVHMDSATTNRGNLSSEGIFKVIFFRVVLK